MATYKEIHGIKIQYRDSDATAVEGDVWYNSTGGKLKMYASAGSWATGGNLNTGRITLAGAGKGTQTAGLVFGGYTPAPSISGANESYDGSSWTEVGDLNSGRDGIQGA